MCVHYTYVNPRQLSNCTISWSINVLIFSTHPISANRHSSIPQAQTEAFPRPNGARGFRDQITLRLRRMRSFVREHSTQSVGRCRHRVRSGPVRSESRAILCTARFRSIVNFPQHWLYVLLRNYADACSGPGARGDVICTLTNCSCSSSVCVTESLAWV